MSEKTIAWAAIAAYVLITAFLAYRGWRKTRSSMESFAVGNRTASPVWVGLSLAAQLTSVATFVVNPGLVFAYGLSGLLGFGVAAALGITIGIIVFTRAFRRVGDQTTALTVPQWVGARFKSKGLSLWFAFLSLALVSFIVLIVVAIAIMLHFLVDLPAWIMALGVILFVFTYVALGGVNTHVQTNAFQALIMLVAAVILVATGLPYFWQGEGLFARLAAIDPVLVSTINPSSLYFRNLFEVFGCNFLIGLALVCQPHILSKSLYLKSEKDVRTYLIVAVLAGAVFSMTIWVGLFARMEVPAATAYDAVVATYVSHFGFGLQLFITIGMLCAGISTLEGILLALSTVISVDGFLGIFPLKNRSKESKAKLALIVSRGSIVLLGVVAFLLALWQLENPTGQSVAIFGQYGVYALITASIVPLATGMFVPSAHKIAVAVSTVGALSIYLAVFFLEITSMYNNPAFLATCGILGGWCLFGLVQLVARSRGAHRVAPDQGAAEA